MLGSQEDTAWEPKQVAAFGAPCIWWGDRQTGKERITVGEAQGEEEEGAGTEEQLSRKGKSHGKLFKNAEKVLLWLFLDS